MTGGATGRGKSVMRVRYPVLTPSPTCLHGHGRRRKAAAWCTGGEKGIRQMGKRRRAAVPAVEELVSPVNSLDDGCLMHIFSFLSPIPGSIRSSNFTLPPPSLEK